MASTLIKHLDKMIAVNVITGEFQKDLGAKDQPRVYTVEYVDSQNSMYRLFQMGTYLQPLWFDLDGNPCLSSYSRSSSLFKIWTNYKLIKKETWLHLQSATNSTSNKMLQA